jgi:hypothetical protein
MVQSVQKSTIDRDAWIAYTPTYSSDSGDANTTYTGPGLVSSFARYKVNGKSLFLNISFGGLLNAVTPTVLYATIPPGYTLQNSSVLTPAVIRNNGTYETGLLIPDAASGKLKFYRAGFATYTASGLVTGAVSVALELA